MACVGQRGSGSEAGSAYSHTSIFTWPRKYPCIGVAHKHLHLAATPRHAAPLHATPCRTTPRRTGRRCVGAFSCAVEARRRLYPGPGELRTRGAGRGCRARVPGGGGGEAGKGKGKYIAVRRVCGSWRAAARHLMQPRGRG
ncbi:hypothetical protein E2C01_091901 [Portunus trituberculatus]|uniref:Uncharacterized protein n=1 Tax=Portunus trituberculatus TaxID=210409 RepID=A0A5B7JF67_PORTR|nr:hypothetical protein [Portunus trituberculatus]